jgi:hypothetical protein
MASMPASPLISLSDRNSAFRVGYVYYQKAVRLLLQQRRRLVVAAELHTAIDSTDTSCNVLEQTQKNQISTYLVSFL